MQKTLSLMAARQETATSCAASDRFKEERGNETEHVHGINEVA